MVALLAGLNLTTQLTASHLPQLQFVRLRELLSLLFITPVSLALLFRIIWALEGGRRDAKWVMTLFVISAALVAVAMGVHEPINALRNTANKSELALMSDSLWFWDDLFSHVVFFAGFVGTSLTLILSQMRNPLPDGGWRGHLRQSGARRAYSRRSGDHCGCNPDSRMDAQAPFFQGAAYCADY
jgi:hypothetical protein